MDVLYQSCAGIDVHQATVVVCILHGPHESAGKKRSTKIRHGNSYLKRCLCQAVFAAKRQKGSPLAERYFQIQSRGGPQKATIALAHQLLKIAYILLKENLTYQEFVLQKKATRDEPVA